MGNSFFKPWEPFQRERQAREGDNGNTSENDCIESSPENQLEQSNAANTSEYEPESSSSTEEPNAPTEGNGNGPNLTGEIKPVPKNTTSQPDSFFFRCVEDYGEEEAKFIMDCVDNFESGPSGYLAQCEFFPPDPRRHHEPKLVWYFMRKVVIWEPLKQFPSDIVPHMKCPHCQHAVQYGRGRKRTRTVVDLEGYFILVYKEYKCSSCTKTFVNTDDRALKLLPAVVRSALPFVLLHRSAYTLQLRDEIYRLGTSLGPKAIAKFVNQRHIELYEQLHLHYLADSTRKDSEAKARRDSIANSPFAPKRHGPEEARRQEFVKEWKEKWELAKDLASRPLSYKKADRHKGGHSFKIHLLSEAKVLLLANIPDSLKLLDPQLRDEFEYLSKFQDRGITTAWDLANFPIEKFTSENLKAKPALINELCILTGGDPVKARKKATLRESAISTINQRVSACREVILKAGRIFATLDDIAGWLEKPKVPPDEILQANFPGVDDENDSRSNVDETETLLKPPAKFGAYDDENGYRGKRLTHTTISALINSTFEERKPMICQTLASFPTYYLKFDALWKISNWVKVVLPHSGRVVPLLECLFCGMNQLGQVVMLQFQEFKERFVEISECLEQVQKCQKAMQGENWKLHACWSDDCCRNAGLLRKVFGVQCASKLDYFHWRERFKDFVDEPNNNPLWQDFKADLRNACFLKGDEAIQYIIEKNLFLKYCPVKPDETPTQAKDQTEARARLRRYKTEIDVIPDPGRLYTAVKAVIDKYLHQDNQARLEFIREKSEFDAFIRDEVLRESERLRKYGQVLSKAGELAVSNRYEYRKPVHRPVLFKLESTVASAGITSGGTKRCKFTSFLHNQLAHVQNGCLSDPISDNLPLFFKMSDGTLKTVRGTNDLENFFQKLQVKLRNYSFIGVRRAEMLVLETAFARSYAPVWKLLGDDNLPFHTVEFCRLANSFYGPYDIERKDYPFPQIKSFALDPESVTFGFFVRKNTQAEPKKRYSQAIKCLEDGLETLVRTGAQSQDDNEYVTGLGGRSLDRAAIASLLIALEKGGHFRIMNSVLTKFFPPYTDVPGLLETAKQHGHTNLCMEAHLDMLEALHKTNTKLGADNLPPNKSIFSRGTLARRLRTSQSESVLKFLFGARLVVFAAVKRACRKDASWSQVVGRAIKVCFPETKFCDDENPTPQEVIACLEVHERQYLGIGSGSAVPWSRPLNHSESANPLFLVLLCASIRYIFGIELCVRVFSDEKEEYLIPCVWPASASQAPFVANLEYAIHVSYGSDLDNLRRDSPTYSCLFPVDLAEAVGEEKVGEKRKRVKENQRNDFHYIRHRAKISTIPTPFSFGGEFLMERIIFYRIVKSPTLSVIPVEDQVQIYNGYVARRLQAAKDLGVKVFIRGCDVQQFLYPKTKSQFAAFAKRTKNRLGSVIAEVKSRLAEWIDEEDDLLPNVGRITSSAGEVLEEALFVADYGVNDLFEESALEQLAAHANSLVGQQVGALAGSSNFVLHVLNQFPKNRFAPFILDDGSQFLDASSAKLDQRRVCSYCGYPRAAYHPKNQFGRSCPQRLQAIAEAKENEIRPSQKHRKSTSKRFQTSQWKKTIDLVSNLQPLRLNRFGDILTNSEENLLTHIEEILPSFEKKSVPKDRNSFSLFEGQDMAKLLGEGMIEGKIILRFLRTVHYNVEDCDPRWSFRAISDFAYREENETSCFPLVHRWDSEHYGLDSDVVLSPFLVNTHWTLFAIFISEKRIEHYDSLSGYLSPSIIEIGAQMEIENLMRIREFFKIEIPIPDFSEWEIDWRESAQQAPNSVDCGAFLLFNAWHLTKGLKPPVQNVSGRNLRKGIGLKLWEHIEDHLDIPMYGTKRSMTKKNSDTHEIFDDEREEGSDE